MGHMNLTMYSGVFVICNGVFVICRVVFAMLNLCTKFKGSRFTLSNDMKEDSTFKNRGDFGC